VEPEIVSS